MSPEPQLLAPSIWPSKNRYPKQYILWPLSTHVGTSIKGQSMYYFGYMDLAG